MSKRPIPYLSYPKIILFELAIPLIMVGIAAYLLDYLFWEKLRLKMVSVPTYGPRFEATRLYSLMVQYHFPMILTPLLLLITIGSWQAQGPGPGRALLRLFGEGTYPLFPPSFSYNDPDIIRRLKEVRGKDPGARLLGFYKRFRCDIDQERKQGLSPGTPGQYFPIILDEGVRYRHLQVVGSTGSGKSASVIAPLLFQDAMTEDLATFTINPKSDTYLLKCMATGVIKNSRNSSHPPTALVSMVRKESLAYDPLIYGTADICTKKIIGSMEFESSYYRGVQETWLMTFFRVVKTEPALNNRIMLRHLLGFLVNPQLLQVQVKPLLSLQENIDRVDVLSQEEKKNLSGVAAHVGTLVEDESLAHIFNNPQGKYLDLREVIRAGGNVFIEVDTNAKGAQSRALGRMLIMELQLFASARQAGTEPTDPGVMCYIDEFASFSYNDFIGLLDKSRSAKVGFLLAHQTIGNFHRSYLSSGFKAEVVDNTRSKFIFDVKDETAKWASELLGEQRVNQISESVGTAKDFKVTRSNKSKTTREEWDLRAVPDFFNLPLGHGFAQLQNKQGRIINCPVTVGYVDEKVLCSDSELFAFLSAEQQRHSSRPLGGSLIDNKIPFQASAPTSPIQNEADEEADMEDAGDADFEEPEEVSPVQMDLEEAEDADDDLDKLLGTEV